MLTIIELKELCSIQEEVSQGGVEEMKSVVIITRNSKN